MRRVDIDVDTVEGEHVVTGSMSVPLESRFVLVEGIPRDASWDALQSAFSDCPPRAQDSAPSGSSGEIKGIFNGLLTERGTVRTSRSFSF